MDSSAQLPGEGGLDSLPDHILGRILVSAGAAWPDVRLVCKRWHRVYLSQPELWHQVKIRVSQESPGVDPDQRLAALVRRVRRIGPLIQRFSIFAINSSSAMYISACRELPGLLQLLSPEALRLLEIRLEPSAEAVEILPRFSQLDSLTLNGYSPQLPANAAAVIRKLKQLTLLRLDMGDISAVLLAALCSLPQLTNLHMCTPAALPDVQPLTVLSTLMRLELQEFTAPEEGLELQLPAAGIFPSLCLLAVHADYIKLPCGTLMCFVEPEGRSDDDYPYLKMECSDGDAHVGIDEARLEGSCGLQTLLHALLPPQATLVSLQLAFCHISEQTARGCGPLLAATTRLSVHMCLDPGVGTDAGVADAIAALLELTPCLRHLHIVGGYGAESNLKAGLPAAVAELQHLQVLAVIDAGLASLPELPHFAGLEILDLRRNCLRRLPAGLARAICLTELRLSGNPGLALDEEASDVLALLPAIATLDLGAGAAVAALARRVPNLRVV